MEGKVKEVCVGGVAVEGAELWARQSEVQNCSA